MKIILFYIYCFHTPKSTEYRILSCKALVDKQNSQVTKNPDTENILHAIVYDEKLADLVRNIAVSLHNYRNPQNKAYSDSFFIQKGYSFTMQLPENRKENTS